MILGMTRSLVALGLVLLVWAPLLAAGRGTLQRASTTLDESVVIDRMASAIQDYVATRLSREQEEIDVKRISPVIADLSVGDRVSVQQGQEGANQRGLLGRAVFLLLVERENGSESQYWVTAMVSVIRQVFVADLLIPRKTPVSPGSVSLATVYQTQLDQEYIEREEDFLGRRSIRAILPGEPITTNRIEDAPVIRRGDRVTIVVSSAGIKITESGQAKKDGFLGQPLDVITHNSKKVVSGTVISASEVLVSF